MIAFIHRHVVLTICKFRFEAFFTPTKIISFLTNNAAYEEAYGMHNRETHTPICARLICVCVVRIYLSCTVRLFFFHKDKFNRMPH